MTSYENFSNNLLDYDDDKDIEMMITTTITTVTKALEWQINF
jgi:hypothetical protein